MNLVVVVTVKPIVVGDCNGGKMSPLDIVLENFNIEIETTRVRGGLNSMDMKIDSVQVALAFRPFPYAPLSHPAIR